MLIFVALPAQVDGSYQVNTPVPTPGRADAAVSFATVLVSPIKKARLPFVRPSGKRTRPGVERHSRGDLDCRCVPAESPTHQEEMTCSWPTSFAPPRWLPSPACASTSILTSLGFPVCSLTLDLGREGRVRKANNRHRPSGRARLLAFPLIGPSPRLEVSQGQQAEEPPTRR